jgi:hypothetical protein
MEFSHHHIHILSSGYRQLYDHDTYKPWVAIHDDDVSDDTGPALWPAEEDTTQNKNGISKMLSVTDSERPNDFRIFLVIGRIL